MPVEKEASILSSDTEQKMRSRLPHEHRTGSDRKQKIKKMKTNEQMTAERSLEIISQSIEQSRRVIEKNAGQPMVLWGLLTALNALVVGHLWEHNGGPVWNFLWGLFWIIGLIAERLIIGKKESVPVSFIGKIIGHVWTTFGIFCMLIGLGLGLIAAGILPLPLLPNVKHAFVPISAYIIASFGIASSITGLILRNNWIVGCGILSGGAGFYLALMFPGAQEMIVMAGVSVVGLVIPGLIINLQTKRSCSSL